VLAARPEVALERILRRVRAAAAKAPDRWVAISESGRLPCLFLQRLNRESRFISCSHTRLTERSRSKVVAPHLCHSCADLCFRYISASWCWRMAAFARVAPTRSCWRWRAATPSCSHSRLRRTGEDKPGSPWSTFAGSALTSLSMWRRRVAEQFAVSRQDNGDALLGVRP
jgi:hypothetical protein